MTEIMTQPNTYTTHPLQITKVFDPTHCQICMGTFTPKGPHHKNCSDKCAYISNLLNRDHWPGMTRDEAIAYYGKMYEDPLHSLGRSKHKQLVRVLYDYCEAHGVTTFTQQEIDAIGKIRIHSQSLAACATAIRAVSKTGRRVKNRYGKPMLEWQFKKELL